MNPESHDGRGSVTQHDIRVKVTAVRESNVWSVTSTAVHGFIAHDDANRAAVVAYYTLLSIFPMILGLVALLGFVISDPAARDAFVRDVSSVFPGATELIQENVDALVRGRGTATFFATLTLIWSGSGVFGAVSAGLNAIWESDKPRGFIGASLRAVAMVVGVGIVFVLSLVVSTVLQFTGGMTIPLIDFRVSSIPLLFPLIEFVLPLIITVLVFTLAYKFVPHTTVSWQAAFIGGLFAGLLFEVGKQLFAFYLGTFAYLDAVYGSIGAVVALMTWAYYSGIILFAGAELSRAVGLVPRHATVEPPVQPGLLVGQVIASSANVLLAVLFAIGFLATLLTSTIRQLRH